MTNKIIIDGVNVAKCKHYKDGECACYYKAQCGYEITGFDLCIKHRNCYYKQLKRKEQECEALKQSENEAVEIIAELKNDYAELEKRHNDSFEQFKNLKIICDDYKIANAELDKENKELLKFKEIQEKELLDLRVTLGEIKKENEELKETVRAYKEDRFCQGGCAIYQYDKIHKLTQALDEIEKIADKKDCETIIGIGYCSECGSYTCRYKKILNLINKAREQ